MKSKRVGWEFQKSIVSFAGFLRDRVAELDDWSKIKLLTVQINRLRDWCRDGLLCIGDSAHAMSPAGGVGINLAIQDAVATANLLGEKLRTGPVSVNDLRKCRASRMADPADPGECKFLFIGDRHRSTSGAKTHCRLWFVC